jgi:hypothetical protein
MVGNQRNPEVDSVLAPPTSPGGVEIESSEDDDSWATQVETIENQAEIKDTLITIVKGKMNDHDCDLQDLRNSLSERDIIIASLRAELDRLQSNDVSSEQESLRPCEIEAKSQGRYFDLTFMDDDQSDIIPIPGPFPPAVHEVQTDLASLQDTASVIFRTVNFKELGTLKIKLTPLRKYWQMYTLVEGGSSWRQLEKYHSPEWRPGNVNSTWWARRKYIFLYIEYLKYEKNMGTDEAIVVAQNIYEQAKRIVYLKDVFAKVMSSVTIEKGPCSGLKLAGIEGIDQVHDYLQDVDVFN